MRSALRWFQSTEDRDQEPGSATGAPAPATAVSASASANAGTRTGSSNANAHTLAQTHSHATGSASDLAACFAATAHAGSPVSLNSSSLTQSPSPQPATPPDLFPRASQGAFAAPPTSKPISICTPPRDSFISSSRNNLFAAFSDLDCDDVDMTTGPALDAAMSRSRQDSFVSAGPKPISVNNQNRDNVNRNRRESLAGSLMGISWGGMSFGSFVRDE